MSNTPNLNSEYCLWPWLVPLYSNIQKVWMDHENPRSPLLLLVTQEYKPFSHSSVTHPYILICHQSLYFCLYQHIYLCRMWLCLTLLKLCVLMFVLMCPSREPHYSTGWRAPSLFKGLIMLIHVLDLCTCASTNLCTTKVRDSVCAVKTKTIHWDRVRWR